LKRFRAAATEIYGERFERAALYGSRARRPPPGFRLRYCRLHQRPRQFLRRERTPGRDQHGYCSPRAQSSPPTPFPTGAYRERTGVHAQAAQGRRRRRKPPTISTKRACLADATQIATLPLPHAAAREAYIAVFMPPKPTSSSTPARWRRRIAASAPNLRGWPGASRVSDGQSLMSLV
jgi:hypothetical protein